MSWDDERGFPRRDPRQNRRIASGSSFRPTQLPGLKLWLRSDLGITIGTGVSAWADQSGNANNATQGTGSAQPTYNASDANYNGRPTLSFAAASSQMMSLVALFPAQPFTAYVVGESATTAGNKEFFGDSTNNVTLFVSSSVWSIFAGSVVASANGTSTKQAFSGVFNGASSALYINSSASAAASGNAGASNPAGTEQIGSSGGANFLNGKIAEVIIYNTAHSTTQVSQILRYLGGLYGGAWS